MTHSAGFEATTTRCEQPLLVGINSIAGVVCASCRPARGLAGLALRGIGLSREEMVADEPVAALLLEDSAPLSRDLPA